LIKFIDYQYEYEYEYIIIMIQIMIIYAVCCRRKIILCCNKL